MRTGQTSFIVFAAKVLASAIGFIGTVYFARKLGPEIIGIYASIVALITWLQLGGKIGVHGAITKRISEGEERGEYLAASVFTVGVASSVMIVGLLVFRSSVEAFVYEFDEYAEVSLVWFVIILFVLQVTYQITNATLQGQRLVHIVGLLRPVRTGVMNALQFLLVFVFGFGIVGLLIGHAAALAITAVIGIAFISVPLRKPSRQHFVKIYEYARYSWFGELSSRTFSNADILILAMFVPSNLVGIYSVAWSLSSFLNLFSGSISSTMFPEISKVSSEESTDAAAGLIEDAVAYGGFIVIPGMVGGVLLDERLFRIYGTGFGQGAEILWLLLFSSLAYSYLSQFSTALNGLDRPDLAFKTNLIFVFLNVVLNFVLIWYFGWIGAAVASAVSTVLGGMISYYFLTRLIAIKLPVGEIRKQVVAAVGMGAVVWGLHWSNDAFGIVQRNIFVVLGLVTIGAGTYVVTLLMISCRFRAIVRQNINLDGYL